MTERQVSIAAALRSAVFFIGLTIGLMMPALAYSDDGPNKILPLEPPSDTSFSLIDHRGRHVSDADFRGTYLLVYLGYTNCPDVCPTDLQALAEAVDMLRVDGIEIQPIFITVDPERDTVDMLADYVGSFHPKLVGLTGAPENVNRTAKGFGVRYFKIFYPVSDDDEESDGTDTEAMGADYVVYHTAFTYLVGPDGRGLATFPHGEWPEDMVAKIRRLIGRQN